MVSASVALKQLGVAKTKITKIAQTLGTYAVPLIQTPFWVNLQNFRIVKYRSDESSE